jgi:(p)ppGpp synthase/HD superfamily hydrolase
MTNQKLSYRATAFARRAHSAIDQRRKYTGDPYAVHLEAVAQLVANAGGTPEMIAAAWLHDVIEDTSTTVSQIEANFGGNVATLVAELTDVSCPSDGNRAKRKELDRVHLSCASPDAKTVKLADLIDNARSILQHDQRFAKVFMHEMRLLVDVLKEGDPGLYAVAVELISEYQRN